MGKPQCPPLFRQSYSATSIYTVKVNIHTATIAIVAYDKYISDQSKRYVATIVAITF